MTAAGGDLIELIPGSQYARLGYVELGRTVAARADVVLVASRPDYPLSLQYDGSHWVEAFRFHQGEMTNEAALVAIGGDTSNDHIYDTDNFGAALALTTTGLPIDANGDRSGGPLSWFSWHALLGGFGVVAFALVHALAFLALKTDGDVRHRARSWFVRLLPFAVLPMLGWMVAVQFLSGKPWTWVLVAAAAVAVGIAWRAAKAGSEGMAFGATGAFVLCATASIFGAAFPVVIPSTIDPAFDLTISNASSSDYTLGLMSIVAAFGLPLLYGAWRFALFHFLAGPGLASLLTDNPNEMPAIWCLLSIALVFAGLHPWLRGRLGGRGGVRRPA